MASLCRLIPLFMTIFCFTFFITLDVNNFSPTTYGLQRKKTMRMETQMWNTRLSNCILYIWKNVYDVLINWQKNWHSWISIDYKCHYVLHSKILEMWDILKQYVLYLKLNSNSKAFTVSVHYIIYYEMLRTLKAH